MNEKGWTLNKHETPFSSTILTEKNRVFFAQGEKIKETLVEIFDKALGWLRALVGMFLLLYGLYLGVSVAFGQSEPGMITSFFIGAAIALGAQAIAGLYWIVFSGSSGGGGGGGGGM